MYLLDTNTVIYFFKGMGDVSKKLFLHSPSDISIPSIVIYELETGIAKSSSPEKRTKQLDQLLRQINIVDFTHKEAKETAKIRADLETKGTPIGPMDLLIAGCAVANNFTLITRNLREFERVAGLKCESWY